MDKLQEYIETLQNKQLASKEEIQSWVQEAIRDWLDQRISQFGWWSLKTIAAIALASLTALAAYKVGNK